MPPKKASPYKDSVFEKKASPYKDGVFAGALFSAFYTLKISVFTKKKRCVLSIGIVMVVP
jgi:uncharacterized protein with FMN-binding domain